MDLIKILKPDRILNSPDKRLRNRTDGITEPWTGIVIHHTGIGNRSKITSTSLWSRLHKNIANWLSTKDEYYVSSHYQIGRNGELTQIIDPQRFVAFHAGRSSYWNPWYRECRSNCNNNFIGIELVGDGNKQEYSNAQYKRLGLVCKILMRYHHHIRPNTIVGHEMVSPGRKQDPGQCFDWRKLFEYIYR